MLLFFQYYMIPIWYHTFNHLFYVFKWTVQCQLGMEVLEKCLEVSAFGVKAASLSQDSATSCACHVIWHHVMFQWETTWDDCTICSAIARVSIPLFRLVHLQCFPLGVNIRSVACTKFNCNSHVHTMYCTVICCIRFSLLLIPSPFLETNPSYHVLHHWFNHF